MDGWTRAPKVSACACGIVLRNIPPRGSAGEYGQGGGGDAGKGEGGVRARGNGKCGGVGGRQCM